MYMSNDDEGVIRILFERERINEERGNMREESLEDFEKELIVGIQ